MPFLIGVALNLLVIAFLMEASTEMLKKDFMPDAIMVVNAVGLISLAMSAFISTGDNFVEHCVDALIGGLEISFSMAGLWLMQENYKGLPHVEIFIYGLFLSTIIGAIIILKALSYNHKGAKNENIA